MNNPIIAIWLLFHIDWKELYTNKKYRPAQIAFTSLFIFMAGLLISAIVFSI